MMNVNATIINQIEEIKKEALGNKVPIIKDEGLNLIIKTIKENNYHSLLELGTAVGYSAINFSLYLNKVTSIERNIDMYNKAVTNIKKTNLMDKIELVFIDALEYTPKEKYDIIFIDAAKAQYIKFFERYKEYLNPQGVIISDNLLFHNLIYEDEIKNKRLRQLVNKIKKFRTYLEENQEFETKIYNIGDGISISKKRG